VTVSASAHEASYNTPDIGAMLLTRAIRDGPHPDRRPEEGSMGYSRDRVPQGRPR
jgi:hypothetical protein